VSADVTLPPELAALHKLLFSALVNRTKIDDAVPTPERSFWLGVSAAAVLLGIAGPELRERAYNDLLAVVEHEMGGELVVLVKDRSDPVM
jgi:hypothetical protein